ncbi:hypothetical protein BDZ88DRAFT_434419 [Geranomyces variabilis]|nr:hypothetical protein BDZ88DRAFT_434419 [Geranomyces variabilis]
MSTFTVITTFKQRNDRYSRDNARYLRQVTAHLGRQTLSAWPDQGYTEPADAPKNVVVIEKGPTSMTSERDPLRSDAAVWGDLPVLRGDESITVVLAQDPADLDSLEDTPDNPVLRFMSLDAALSHLLTIPHGTIFIAGGERLITSCIADPRCTRILLTRLIGQQLYDGGYVDREPHEGPAGPDEFRLEIPDVFVKASEEAMDEVLGLGRPKNLKAAGSIRATFEMWERRGAVREPSLPLYRKFVEEVSIFDVQR